jgi:hypothetical protein
MQPPPVTVLIAPSETTDQLLVRLVQQPPGTSIRLRVPRGRLALQTVADFTRLRGVQDASHLQITVVTHSLEVRDLAGSQGFPVVGTAAVPRPAEAGAGSDRAPASGCEELVVDKDEPMDQLLASVEGLPPGTRLRLRVPEGAQALRGLEDFKRLRALQIAHQLHITIAAVEPVPRGLSIIYGFDGQSPPPAGSALDPLTAGPPAIPARPARTAATPRARATPGDSPTAPPLFLNALFVVLLVLSVSTGALVVWFFYPDANLAAITLPLAVAGCLLYLYTGVRIDDTHWQGRIRHYYRERLVGDVRVLLVANSFLLLTLAGTTWAGAQAYAHEAFVLRDLGIAIDFRNPCDESPPVFEQTLHFSLTSASHRTLWIRNLYLRVAAVSALNEYTFPGTCCEKGGLPPPIRGAVDLYPELGLRKLTLETQSVLGRRELPSEFRVGLDGFTGRRYQFYVELDWTDKEFPQREGHYSAPDVLQLDLWGDWTELARSAQDVKVFCTDPTCVRVAQCELATLDPAPQFTVLELEDKHTRYSDPQQLPHYLRIPPGAEQEFLKIRAVADRVFRYPSGGNFPLDFILIDGRILFQRTGGVMAVRIEDEALAHALDQTFTAVVNRYSR